MPTTNFLALVGFTVALAIWAGIEVRLGRRSGRTSLASTAPWSEVAISASTVAGLVTAVLLSTSVPMTRIRPASLAFALGIGMMLGGVAVRVLAARSLNSYYTLKLGIQPGQAVYTEGLYRWIRHPGYAGTLLALLGVGMALGNWCSVLAVLLIVPALAARIRLEEQMLRRAFGDAYHAYCLRTRWRLLPRML